MVQYLDGGYPLLVAAPEILRCFGFEVARPTRLRWCEHPTQDISVVLTIDDT